MGLSSKSLVVGEEGIKFAKRLKEGETFGEAYLGAARDIHDKSIIDIDNLTSHKKIYSILYYGPEDGGTLNDTIFNYNPPSYDRSQIRIKKETVHKKSVRDPEEF